MEEEWTDDGKRHRAWCFTRYEDEPPCQSLPEWAKYVCFQRESCPKTGRLHWQGYVVFKSGVTLGACKRNLATRSDVRPARGTAQQNRTYCSKLKSSVGPFMEFGEIPHHGSRTDIISFTRAIQSGASNRDLCDNFANFAARYPKYIDFARGAYDEVPNRRELVVFAFIGPTNTGKTTAAWELFPTAYEKPASKWWPGYSNQRVAIWDEFTDGTISISEFLRITKGFRVTVEYKGGHVTPRFNILVITSNQDVSEWYPSASPAHLQALRGRIRVLDFLPEWQDDSRAAVQAARLFVSANLPASLVSLLASPVLDGPSVPTLVDLT